MKKFVAPEVEVEKFQIEDVLTLSNGGLPELDDSNLGEKT